MRGAPGDLGQYISGSSADERRRFVWMGSAAALGLLIAVPGFPTSFVERPFPETVLSAEGIARGRVGMTYADWSQDPGDERRIFTFIEISVEEALKGNVPASGTLIARELGGEKDGVGMKVHGTATFGRGEEVVVFLKTPANADGSYPLKGLMMGKLEVIKDPASGEDVLRGPALGLSRGHPGHSAEGHSAPDGSKWTLSRLRQLVREQGEPSRGDRGKMAETRGVSSPSPSSASTSAPRATPASSLQSFASIAGEPGQSSVPSDRESLGKLGVLLLGAGLLLGWGVRSFLGGR